MAESDHERPLIQLDAAPRRRKSSAGPSQSLGIRHLLLLTFCAAVNLAAVRYLATESVGTLGFSIVCAQALFVGATWTGMCVAWFRLVRPSGHFLEPGGWLCLALGMRYAVDLMLVWLSVATDDKLKLVPESVQWVAMSCMLVMPTLSRRLPTRWKSVFLVLALFYLWPLILLGLQVWGPGDTTMIRWWLDALAWVRPPVGFCLVGIAAIMDRLARADFGWLHRAGVLIWLLGAVLLFVGRFA